MVRNVNPSILGGVPRSALGRHRTALLVIWAVAVIALVACGGSSGASNTPTAPTVVNSSRTIALLGSLAFGEVVVGATKQLNITVSNSGNSLLTVSRFSVSGFNGQVSTNWSQGQVAAGSSQTVVVSFTPTASGAYSGVLTVEGDQTGGGNSLAVTGAALASVAGNWVGAHAIRQCNGTGSAQDLICSPQRGVNKIGDLYGFSTNLVQSGTAVSGTINIGGITGPVTGVVTTSGLTLRGTATTASGYLLTLTDWRTTTALGSMTGSMSYDLSFRGLNGVAAVVSTLERVTVQ